MFSTIVPPAGGVGTVPSASLPAMFDMHFALAFMVPIVAFAAAVLWHLAQRARRSDGSRPSGGGHAVVQRPAFKPLETEPGQRVA
jgi:hypothetical protein